LLRLRSAPAENSLPAPVSTTTRTSSRSLKVSKTRVSSSTTSIGIEFTGGLSRATTAMPSATSNRTFDMI